MKRQLSVIVGFIVLVFGFQNCNQSGESSTSPISTQQTKIENPDLKVAESLEILTQTDNQTLMLNLASGELIQSSLNGTVKKCVSEGMMSAINDVLQNSSLCEFKPAEGELCAHVYGYPYANINWSDMTVKVGESQSSCHKGPDLCGNDGRVLRGLLRDIVNRWDEWSCDFQSL